MHPLLAASILALVLVSRPGPQRRAPQHTGSRDAALAFLATLGAKEREQAVLAFASPARLRWSPSPGPRRPGLYLSEMSHRQLVACHRLLQSVLSTQGYLAVALVMMNQDVIAKTDEDESSGKYALALYGDPAKDGPWSWRLGGHHVSLHFTYRGDRIVATTPLFLGIAMALEKNEPGRVGLRVLADREDLGRAVFRSLDAEAAAQARLAADPQQCILRGEDATRRAAAEGIEARALPARSRRLLQRLAREYFSDLDAELADIQHELFRAQWPKIRFAWSGASEPGSEHYYRIRGSDFLIEFHYHRNHIHSIWRRADDFGRPSR